MSGPPSFPFYPGDWRRDTAMLSLEQKGAWWELILAMHDSPVYGRLIDVSWSEIGRAIGADSTEHAQSIICRLVDLNICDAVDDTGNVTCHGQSLKNNSRVTLICRRMVKKEKDKHNAKMRQRKCRAKKDSHDPVTSEFKPLSSSSSSSESKKEDMSSTFVLEVLLKAGHGTYKITQPEVDEWQAAFPNINVPKELESLRLWNKDNTDRRKTKAGFRRHVTGWLKRASDDAKAKQAKNQGGTGGFWGKKL